MVQIVSCLVIFGSIFARLSFGIPCADPAQFVAEHAQCLTDNNITFTLPNGVNVTAENVVETLTTVLTLADPTTMCSNLDAWGKALECVVSLAEQCPSAGGGTTYSGQKLDELKKIQLETCFHLKRAGSAMIIPTGGQVHQQRGGTLRLACAGVGPGDGAVFHWTDMNYHVINNTKGRVHVTDMGTSSILVFSNIQDSDAGSYFCGGFSHAADVSDSVAVNVYDAFYVPTVDCGIMENVHAAFQQCVGYYNITGMMFPVPQGDADIVINAANVFFTQDVPEMCRKRRQFSLAARCVTAISAECLNRNRSKGWLDYFHTGNDVVDGMAVICEAYMSGSYNASCVSSVEDSLVRCVNEEYKTWLSQPVETHGVGKASTTMCRLYSASLDCAEKVLQVCKPKMTTVERFADAYKNMKPSQCATEDGKPGPVTDP
ncbi:uncharacterized protein LOC124134750 [Haliotis rufescens]|uniref:uncharacterized protein LOC124134750 n=1 Tax=Haliotis rufescens TaxID=6454 RepID=UPI00201EBEFA|nr:uncharacterized protein LOC124134750 [Haliotis rufescens]XP_048238459.1 uncharacterized protein LOC124134750 [Haliotis rufescens]